MDAKAQLAKSLKKIYPHISPAACANLADQLDAIIVRTTSHGQNLENVDLWRHLNSESFLTRLREKAGLSKQQVCQAFSWSLAKLNRHERGEQQLTIPEVMVIKNLYNITDPAEIAELESMVKSKTQRTNPA